MVKASSSMVFSSFCLFFFRVIILSRLVKVEIKTLIEKGTGCRGRIKKKSGNPSTAVNIYLPPYNIYNAQTRESYVRIKIQTVGKKLMRSLFLLIFPENRERILKSFSYFAV